MFENYLKITIRNLRKHKAYTSINITGLTIGIACFLLIMLFVQHELSYDRFHHKADRVYRVIAEYPEREQSLAAVSAPLASLLTETYPEILQAARLSKGWPEVAVNQGKNKFYESRFYFAEPALFDLLDLALLRGDPHEVLSRPYQIVLPEKTARKYFGDVDPVGSILSVRASNNEYEFTVSGVLEDIPSNSHLQVDFLAFYATLYKIPNRHPDDWRSGAYTYVLLGEGESPHELEQKLISFANLHIDGREGQTTRLHLQALTDIHLSSRAAPGQDISTPGDIRYLYLFSAIGILILLIACINYMNLATASSALRIKEVGVRKVVGARRGQLVAQFLGESLFLTLFALVLALAVVELSLPVFNRLLQKQPGLPHLGDSWALLKLLALAGGIGVISGSYPAFLLSAFLPKKILKGHRPKSSQKMRNGLVIFQFSIMVVLIGSTVTIQRQLNYIQTKRLGFNQEQVLIIPTKQTSSREFALEMVRFKQLLLQHPDITCVSIGSDMFGASRSGGGSIRMTSGDFFYVDSFDMDSDFVQTLDLELVAGRALSPNSADDREQGVILNETAVRKLRLADPIGQPIQFSFNERPLYITGVVKDFHNRSLHEEIMPGVIMLKSALQGDNNYAVIKMKSADVAAIVAYAKAQWEDIAPAYPFEYSFLDEDLEALYREDHRFKIMFEAFAAIAVFIACLGLFGLAAFTVVQRQKEIGIRKVLGASIMNILLMLTGDFIRLVLLGVVVATPVAYIVMQQWLAGFAYRIDPDIITFFLVGAFVVAVAMMTVSYQSIKASRADPVRSMRYE